MAYFVHYTRTRLYESGEQTTPPESGNAILRRTHPIKWAAEQEDGTHVVINFFTAIPDAAIKHAGRGVLVV